MYSHQTNSDVLCFRNCLLFIVVVVVTIVSVNPKVFGSSLEKSCKLTNVGTIRLRAKANASNTMKPSLTIIAPLYVQVVMPQSTTYQ
jgi:hypothetical protein